MRICETRVCETRVCEMRVCEMRVCEMRVLGKFLPSNPGLHITMQQLII